MASHVHDIDEELTGLPSKRDCRICCYRAVGVLVGLNPLCIRIERAQIPHSQGLDRNFAV